MNANYRRHPALQKPFKATQLKTTLAELLTATNRRRCVKCSLYDSLQTLA